MEGKQVVPTTQDEKVAVLRDVQHCLNGWRVLHIDLVLDVEELSL